MRRITLTQKVGLNRKPLYLDADMVRAIGFHEIGPNVYTAILQQDSDDAFLVTEDADAVADMVFGKET